jgi:hypothetical protein
LTGAAYSATLTATGGQGAYHWSIERVGDPFVNGLAIDANTGVLSGTANFTGTATFLAAVTDSGSPAQRATAPFMITANAPLSVPATANRTITEYSSQYISLSINGGVSPYTYSMDPMCLPPGLKSTPTNLQVGGSNVIVQGGPIVVGTFVCRITVQDSFSPPEVATQVLTIVVEAVPLRSADSFSWQILLNRPFSDSVLAVGGVPPYAFTFQGTASLPPGLSLDRNSGRISGTPTSAGSYGSFVRVTDSSASPPTVITNVSITVVPPKGRNDSPATATAIGNGSFEGSISPYIDPSNGTPAPGDQDYYKLVSLGGATVHVETTVKRRNPLNPLDTVIEIVDGNGRRLSTCRLPGDTSTNFNSACINDDISSPPQHVQDSALDFLVPGAANAATTFYVHVLDWRGDARPDMTYSLNVSGVSTPMTISTVSLKPAARGMPYGQRVESTLGTGAVSWSRDSGALPPGLTLNPDGTFAGVATSNGTYAFTVRATDSGNPPQTTTKALTIQVVDPITITSPAIWPDACVNMPYSFTVRTSGGAPPFIFSFYSARWVAIYMQWVNGVYTGEFSGLANETGTFTGRLTARDATPHEAAQDVTLTVKPCP